MYYFLWIFVGPWCWRIKIWVTMPNFQINHVSRGCLLQSLCYNIEDDTKWPTFPRRHFQIKFLKGNAWISLKMSLKFVPKVRIRLTKFQHWFRWWPGDKSVSKPMMINLYASLGLNELMNQYPLFPIYTTSIRLTLTHRGRDIMVTIVQMIGIEWSLSLRV